MIVTPGNSNLICRALRLFAEESRRAARNRKWGGEQFTRYRALLRSEAVQADALADSLEAEQNSAARR
jgi:hypothetical protein